MAMVQKSIDDARTEGERAGYVQGMSAAARILEHRANYDVSAKLLLESAEDIRLQSGAFAEECEWTDIEDAEDCGHYTTACGEYMTFDCYCDGEPFNFCPNCGKPIQRYYFTEDEKSPAGGAE